MVALRRIIGSLSALVSGVIAQTAGRVLALLIVLAVPTVAGGDAGGPPERFSCRTLRPVRQIAKGQEWQVTIPPGNWGVIWLQTVRDDPCDRNHHRWTSGALRPALNGQPTSAVLKVD